MINDGEKMTEIPLAGYHLTWFLENQRLRETIPDAISSREPLWRLWAGVPGEGWVFCERDDPPGWRKIDGEQDQC